MSFSDPSVGEEARGLRAEIEQGADGGAGAAAGAEFHDLSEQDERGDGGGGFEVDVGISAHAAERVGKNSGREGGDHAVDVGDAGAEADQREHVRAAVDERRPEALEERQAAPEDDGRGESEFEPRQTRPFESAMNSSRPDHATHRDGEQRHGENDADQKRRVMSRSSGFSSDRGGDGARLEGHAADGARSGLGAHDLGMHGAGVFGARGGEWDVGLEGHAAGGTGSGLGLAHFGAHGADVGGRASGFRLSGYEYAASERGRDGIPSVTRPDDAGLFRYAWGLALNFSTQPAQQK